MNGNEAMIGAYSYKMNEAQKNYSVTDKELLAMVMGIGPFRHYLAGKEFLLKTGHKALEYLKTAQDTTSRLLRYSLKLQKYKYHVLYVKGGSNIADCLSSPIEKNSLSEENT